MQWAPFFPTACKTSGSLLEYIKKRKKFWHAKNGHHIPGKPCSCHTSAPVVPVQYLLSSGQFWMKWNKIWKKVCFDIVVGHTNSCADA